jgi:DNA-binding CsgD family transcriptional regulator
MSQVLDTKLSIVEAWHAAYNERDPRALCSLTHPDVEFMSMRPLLAPLLGTSFHGHTGLCTLMRWTFENYPNILVESCSAREIPRWTLAPAVYVIDSTETPIRRREVFGLFDIDGGLIRRVRAYATEHEALATDTIDGTLTKREREVFELLGRGYTAMQIADELVLSPLTVRTHVQNGIVRLGAKTRMHALAIALKSGEIQS